MMHAHVPTTLQYQGRQLNYAGVGRTRVLHIHVRTGMRPRHQRGV